MSKAAKADNDNNLAFKRTVPLPQSKPNILTFANQDSRLILAFEEGTIASYDTAALLSPGDNPVQPAHSAKLQVSALKQIAPNPGTEANLVDQIAVVGDGFVSLLNTQLQPQGRWAGSDSSTTPAAGASNCFSYFSLF